MIRPRAVVLALALLGLSGCQKVYTAAATAPTRPGNTPAGTTAIADKVEFRVFGANVGLVTITFTDSNNGLTRVTGAIPYLATIVSSEDSIFLFLEATASALTTANLQCQIFVNGKLFREAASSGFLLDVQAYGTWTHH